MYQYQSQPFGRFETHLIEADDGQTRLVVSPDGCAALLDLMLGGQSVLDAYATPEALAGNAWYKNVPLFPFPNRLRDGAYEWLGRSHYFPVNDGATSNALHGLSRDFRTTVERVDITDAFAQITCRYQDAGDQEAYPFLYTFDITYRLEGGDRFEGLLSFRNDGDKPLPCGLGWHPYFTLGDRIDLLTLQLPPCELIGIDPRMLPTGKRYAYDDFASPRPIDSTVLDNCFALDDNPGRAEVLLAGPGGRLRYWQETGPGKFNFLQLFTHPERSSLAIEPMTCNIDAFHNGEGLITLEPGETAAARFGLIWEG